MTEDGGRIRGALMAIVREDWEVLDRPRNWDLTASPMEAT